MYLSNAMLEEHETSQSNQQPKEQILTYCSSDGYLVDSNYRIASASDPAYDCKNNLNKHVIGCGNLKCGVCDEAVVITSGRNHACNFIEDLIKALLQGEKLHKWKPLNDWNPELSQESSVQDISDAVLSKVLFMNQQNIYNCKCLTRAEQGWTPLYHDTHAPPWSCAGHLIRAE